MLRSFLFWDITQLRLRLVTDVSGQPVGPILQGSSTQITNYQPTLHNIPEERMSHLQGLCF